MLPAHENYSSEFKIIVYSPVSQAAYSVGSTEVHYLNSNQYDRWDAFILFPDSWLCFFDADCAFTEPLVDQLKKTLAGQDRSAILCGRYEDQAKAPLLASAYNFICNTWLEAGLQIQQARLLGGFFAIYSSAELRSIQFDREHVWGGEDFKLALKLQKHRYQFVLSRDLVVAHLPQTGFKWFLKRAFIQGKHSPSVDKKNYSYVFNRTMNQKFLVGFVVFIHLFFVKIGCFSNCLEVLKAARFKISNRVPEL